MEANILEEGQEDKFPAEERKELDDIKAVINDTILDFHNFEFPKYIGNYKKYLGFVADRLATLDSWQSNVDYPLVASVVDTMFGNIFDFGYEFGINEAKLKKLCTGSFDFRGTGKKVFKEVTKEILICGKGYVKDYLLKEKSSDVFFGKTIKQTIKKPSMYYVSIFDVMYDRSKGLSDSPFKIIRTFATGAAIKAKVLPLVLADLKDGDSETATKKFDKLLSQYKDTVGTRFSMYDYNPVKSLTSTTQFYNSDSSLTYMLPQCKVGADLKAGFSIEGTQGNASDDVKNNYFLNSKTSTYELIEYNTADQKVIFINGNLIYKGKKQYNLGEIREANFSMIPGTGNANGVADNLGGLQDINNMLWNSFLDNIKLVMGPMFKVTGNIPLGKNGTLDFKKFRAFRSNGSTDIEKIQLGVTDFAPINFMQVVQSFSEQRSGVNNYITGGAGSVERVAGGIDIKFNQYKSKLTPITDSIDQMMGNIARSWVLMYLKFFTIDELKKMDIEVKEVFETDEAGVNKFKTFTINEVELESIIDERNITFTFNSLNKLTKENSRAAIKESLMPLLQYAGNQMNVDELIKVLAGQDFDPDNIVVKKKAPANGGYAPEQDFSAPSSRGGNDTIALDTPGGAPDDSGYNENGGGPANPSYDNYTNNYDQNKYDGAYGQSNGYNSGSATPEDDKTLMDELSQIT